jgi:hypothetical protein
LYYYFPLLEPVLGAATFLAELVLDAALGVVAFYSFFL